MPRPSTVSRRIASGARWGDTLVAFLVGAVMLGVIVYAVCYFSRETSVSGGIEGVIARKEFVSQPESQISFGQGGLNTRRIAGEYIFYVRPAHGGGPQYRVYVDPKVYDSFHDGDHYYFIRPPTP